METVAATEELMKPAVMFQILKIHKAMTKIFQDFIITFIPLQDNCYQSILSYVIK